MPLLGIWEDTMNKMEKALYELSEMDDLAAQRSPVHGLCPVAKLLSTIAYIIVAVSFHKYDLSGLVPMVLWPVFLFQLSGIPVRTCFYKLRIVLPLVLAVGLFEPFLDPDITLPAEKRDVGGLGVFLVKKLADRIDYAYTDGQNVVTIEKDLKV